MYFFKSVIDILTVILLLRLLIRPNEAYFHPIYRLIYRITDPVLIPFGYLTRKLIYKILLAIGALLLLRGAVYVSIKPIPFLSGVGISLLSFLRFLFQAYIVMWFISVLSQRSYGSPFVQIIERAFTPFSRLIRRLPIPRVNFHLFIFLFLWIFYSFLAIIIRSIMISHAILPPLSIIQGLGEGLMLILALFPFPGFFSLVIIVGALLSWVGPDPYNPVVQAIYGISEPLLMPFRRIVPNLAGLDISPILALFCFHLLGTAGRQIIEGIIK